MCARQGDPSTVIVPREGDGLTCGVDRRPARPTKPEGLTVTDSLRPGHRENSSRTAEIPLTHVTVNLMEWWRRRCHSTDSYVP